MILASEEETVALGGQLAARARRGDIVALSGPLGVGKTTLVRGFLAGLGHSDEVPSPSFAIVQPYEALEPPAWHVDLYRLEDRSELEELGLDSAGDAILLVEWPERAGGHSWPNALRLSLDFAEAGARRLTAQVPPAWEGRWPPR
ncbi:tRNA (adenosine(37)-N6)-threonylcarbamoyltransferase complex ATPase subunit type 1 TsaE [Sphingomonas sp.]|uniref:tRNA (adenosine(37)-N6)-threonylcarbamoyltransferase complex ATPase subunit type 1 TsaE n=1 Tax=Sphingomonas sp. TaxID=28214 RepID=UPI0017CC65F7|nr:tRNA (adenosine(37)-N6)-threonylcarbamoyltransferase complex ATPase subunit type 1 TsaE [Sphingomonas sp.]MBA3511635.1 tRNA (adenosine(37)-N6)-threonylcarbamoyltransferase complex ATPase subunit type 1 TsaE [Sphingomonas sp.]